MSDTPLTQAFLTAAIPELKLSTSVVHNGHQHMMALCTGGFEDGRTNRGADAMLLRPSEFATLIELLEGDRKSAKRGDLVVSYVTTSPIRKGVEPETVGVRLTRGKDTAVIPVEALPRVMMGLHAAAIWILSGGSSRVAFAARQAVELPPDEPAAAEETADAPPPVGA